MNRCQLEAEACVGCRLQQLPCDERAVVRGACVVLHVSIVSTMQTKAGSDDVFPHQPVARCLCFIVDVATTRQARYVCSCVMECSSSSNRQRNAPRAVEPGTSLMARQRTLFFAHDIIAQQSKSAQRWRAAVAAASQGWNDAMCVRAQQQLGGSMDAA